MFNLLELLIIKEEAVVNISGNGLMVISTGYNRPAGFSYLR